MWLIGRRWKSSNGCSRAVLIGRGLDHNLASMFTTYSAVLKGHPRKGVAPLQLWWQGDVEPPVPIPNTTVKRVSSENTAPERVWEGSPPPEQLSLPRNRSRLRKHPPLPQGRAGVFFWPYPVATSRTDLQVRSRAQLGCNGPAMASPDAVGDLRPPVGPGVQPTAFGLRALKRKGQARGLALSSWLVFSGDGARWAQGRSSRCRR